MSIRIAAIGDVAPVRSFERSLLQHPFEEVVDPSLSDLLNEFDLCAGNIECTLTDAETFSTPGYGLRITPSLAPLFRQMGITLATLANNHIRDLGDQGVKDTLRALKHVGIPTIGAGETLEAANRPAIFEIQGVRIGWIAVAERENNLATPSRAGAAPYLPQRLPDQIATLRAEVDHVVVSIHAGHEFCMVPSPEIIGGYRAAIDAGASAVIGHHPHVIQGVEEYGGGVIFYSLGNFCFDSDYVSAYPGWDLGLVAELIFHGAQIRYALHPIGIRRDIPNIRLLQGPGKAAALKKMQVCSALLACPDALQKEWLKHVRWRFERDYLPHLDGMSGKLKGAGRDRYLRHLKNYFFCPTHGELIIAYLEDQLESQNA